MDRPRAGDAPRHARLAGWRKDLQRLCQPLADPGDDDRIVAWLGDASIVLLGEATHGTREFYETRARLTRRLVEQRGFSAIAIEGDWPDAYQVHRYIRGESGSAAAEALEAFGRFPAWMWRNQVVADMVEWLRAYNAGGDRDLPPVGFYGLDLYSLHASMREVVSYLESRDPAAAAAARASYACFEDFGTETETYAWATGRLGDESCAESVARELVRLHRHRQDLLRGGGPAAVDAFFQAEQNARLARNAERYYRTMVQGRVASWNVRDEHMAETLDELLAFLRAQGRPPKVVVWAHNSHLGDARATEMGDGGELNLGQLARERYGDRVRSIGFTTYDGAVMAASDWGEAGKVMTVRPALDGSYEELFHALDRPAFFLPCGSGTPAAERLRDRRLERAIGVIYRPDSERFSHYFQASLPEQFDAIIHIDRTSPVQPLAAAPRSADDLPETFPSGV